MRKIDMNLSDFYRNDFQESFKVNDNHEVLTEFNDDYSLITIDNFFKYPDQVVDIVKRFPINDKTEYYKKLKEESGVEPTWNFNKYLISKEGRVVSTFKSGVKPDSPELVSAIEKIL